MLASSRWSLGQDMGFCGLGVGLSQPPQLWPGAEISLVVLLLVSGNTGPPLLAGPLSHSPQYHNGLATSISGYECFCRSMPRGDSWFGKWEGCQYLRPQSPASKTSSQSRLWPRVNFSLSNPSWLAMQQTFCPWFVVTLCKMSILVKGPGKPIVWVIV